MYYHVFRAIIQDIEKNLEGDGYFLHFYMKSGDIVTGGWKSLDSKDLRDVLVVSDNDQPPYYLPLSEVEFIQLSS